MEKEKFTVKTKKYKGETSVISIRLPNDLIKQIDNVSEESGRPRNEILLMALEYAIDNLEIKK